jgi:hypothetical protein
VPSPDQTLVSSTWVPPPGPGPGGTVLSPEATRRDHWSSGARAGAGVAAVLVLAAAGLGVGAGLTGGRGQPTAVSTMPGAFVPAAARQAVVPSFVHPHRGGSTTVPSTTVPSTSEPPSTDTPSTDTPSTDTPTSPTGSAVAGLAPLIGDWTGHGGAVHIGANGQGQATFRAYRFCSDDPTPPCDTMNGNTIVPGGHAQFRLTPAGAPGSAKGQVTGSDDPEAFKPGFAMTISLSSGDVMLVSSSPTAQSVAYCGSRASAGACGA